MYVLIILLIFHIHFIHLHIHIIVDFQVKKQPELFTLFEWKKIQISAH